MEEAIINKIAELLIDKTDWKLTKFGEVAIQQKKTVDRDNTSLTRYVKGEHMGSEDLHLREWGELTDEYLGPAFIRYFEKDDILYGSRRTYLRKVVIAPFEGITSNTTFVIKANEKKIDKRLLPYIMMTDEFTEHSVRNSKGSVNPYINWKDISEYEFLLPPKDQQAQLAELLWAMDEVIEREKKLGQQILQLRSVQINDIYHKLPKAKKNILFKKIGDLIKLSSGKTRPSDLQNEISGEYLFPVYGGNGVIGYAKEYLIDFDTVIIGRVGEYCGVVHDSSSKVWISDNALYIKEFLEDIDIYYLSRFLEFIDLNKQQNKSSHPLITQSKIEILKIPIFDAFEMLELTNKLRTIEQSLSTTESKIINSQLLQKSLINQVF